MWWSDLTGYIPVISNDTVSTGMGTYSPRYWLRWNPTKGSFMNRPNTSRGQHLWPGATEEPAQLGHLFVPLSQAVSLVQVSSTGSSALGLCLYFYVDSQEGTQQLRAPKGTETEASRLSGNSGLGQVNIVSTVFHHSKWESHRLSLVSGHGELNTPLSMWVLPCVHKKGDLRGTRFKDQLPEAFCP